MTEGKKIMQGNDCGKIFKAAHVTFVTFFCNRTFLINNDSSCKLDWLSLFFIDTIIFSILIYFLRLHCARGKKTVGLEVFLNLHFLNFESSWIWLFDLWWGSLFFICYRGIIWKSHMQACKNYRKFLLSYRLFFHHSPTFAQLCSRQKILIFHSHPSVHVGISIEINIYEFSPPYAICIFYVPI